MNNTLNTNSSAQFDGKAPRAGHADARKGEGLKWGVLASAVTSILGLAAPSGAFAADIERATGARQTDTTVNTVGALTTITTQTKRGQNAFNSFNRFNVNPTDTVNLELPTGTRNLINLVWDSQAMLNGTINSYMQGTATSATAGRVFFADPHGVVVGSAGVLNVGALSLSAPTSAFMTTMLGGTTTADAAVEDFLRGKMPLDPTGSISVQGRINAQDDVRLQAHAIDASGVIWVAGGAGLDKLDTQVPVNTGAGTGVRMVNDGGNIVLVAADSATVSGTLHTDGGQLVVQSDNTIDITNGAKLDTRDIAGTTLGVNSQGDSGAITLAGRDIHVRNGALLDAHSTNGFAAGDITVAAAARAGGESGLVTADAQVHVDGTLKGKTIALSADAQADTSWDDAGAPIEGISGALLSGITDIAGSAMGGDLGYLAVNTNAVVAVGATAVLDAKGAVSLAAHTKNSITSTATALQGDAAPQNALSIAALYAALDTTASATVASGAHVTATGALDVKASTDNTVDITATSFATEGTKAATTVAISDIHVDTTASIAAGAVLSVGSLGIDAHNQSSFETSSIARSDPQGAVGLAAAISLQDVNATALLGANVNTGAVTVQAASLTSKNATKSLVAEPKSTPVTIGLAATGNGDASSAVAGLMGNGFAKLTGKLGEQSDDKGGANDPMEASQFRAGAAMTYVDGTHTASAKIADNAVVTASGNLVVHAGIVDNDIGASAISTIDAKKPDDGSNTGSSTAISAGVNLVNLGHSAVAEVGKNAQLTGARIGVGSSVSLPMDFSVLGDAVPDFSSLANFIASMTAAASVVTKTGDLFTSYAAGSSSAGDVAVGGSINVFTVNNTSRAWVGEGAHLTSTAAANATPAWTTALDGTGRTQDWTQAIAVSAFSRSEAIHESGMVKMGLKQGETGDKGAAVGGSFNDVVYDTKTIAGIAADAVVTSNGGVAVDATTKDTVVSMALASGGGGSVGVEGTMAMLDMSSVTHASVSRDAQVTAAKLELNALEDLFGWSIAGSLAMSNSLSVGVSVGIQHLDTDTRAYIGDNDSDAPVVIATTSAGGTGFVHADALEASARTQGLAGVVAVAGAVAKSESTQNPEKPGVIDKAKSSANTKIDGLRAGAADKMANLPLLGSLADKMRGSQSSAGGGGAAPEPEEKPQPKFGIAISGSAAVNLVDQATKAYLDGAHVSGRSGAAVDVGLLALNDSTQASASGSAALSLAKAESSKFSAAIGGAVAYSVVDNETEASATNSVLTDASTVSIEALSAGEQTNVALGLSVNKSTKQDTAVSVAGSFSIAKSSNETKAFLAGSTLTAHAGDAVRNVDIAAYNRTYLGIGAGSLYFGGKGGIGAAATIADISDTTEAAVTGGSITGYQDFDLNAIDAARIVAGAAIAGGGAETNGFAGAVVYNTVTNTTQARVDGGAVVNVSDDLTVQAFSSAPIQKYEDRLAAIGADGGFDYSGSSVSLDVDGAGHTDAGTSILAIAGLLQSGKNNVGMALVASTVKNTHSVAIGAATLTAGDAVKLAAADHTAIESFSIGVGRASGQFAGMGNATANIVGNTTQVLIGDATATTNTTTIDAASLDASARDQTFIGSFAGNIALGSKAAAGAAVTYNSTDNTTQVKVARTKVTTTGAVDAKATNDAKIVAAAIAGTVANNAALSGSFAWSETGNTTLASVANSQVDAGSLGVSATSSSDIQTLSGAVAISKQAAIGAAINVATISDDTTAELKDSSVDVDGAVKVAASATGSEASIAVAGAASQNIAVAGSSSTNTVNLTVASTASGLKGLAANSGVRATTLEVTADNSSTAQSLAGAVSASKNAAVGGAISTSLIGGETSAKLSNAVLAVTQSVGVKATSDALIESLAGAGSASSVGIAGTASTNVITRDTRATLDDTSLDQAGTDTMVSAIDSSQIKSLAGSLGFGTNVGVGAAVAVNQVTGDISATMSGGTHNRQYHGRDVVVKAEANADGTPGGNNISTIAAGIGGGGTVGGAASVAVNLLGGTVKANIGSGANVLAERNVGVLASNTQGIDVFAGSLGIGATAGIGLGTVVNMMDAETEASITGATTQVSALAKGTGLAVDAGDLAHPEASDVSSVQSFDDYVAPDISGHTVTINGLAVNASTRQRVATLGVSGAVSFNPVSSVALAAMAGVSIVGGKTTALIQDAQINQHAGQAPNATQDVDVRASSHAVGSNFIAGIAAGAGFSGAAAIAANVFNGSTSAGVRNATLDTRDLVNIQAIGTQSSLVVGVGLAGGLAGGAGTGVVNTFQSSTEAFAEGGSLGGGTLTIDASNRNAASMVGGAVAVGAVAGAATFLIGVSDTRTKAWLGTAGVDTKVDMGGAVTVKADTDTAFQGIAISGAAAGGNAIAGMAQVNVIGNTTSATVTRANLDAASLAVTAHEALSLNAYSGALGLSVAGGAGVGAGANIAILGSHVTAGISGSDIDTSGNVSVNASADRSVDLLTMTAGAGATVGIGGAAALLLSGVGGTGSSANELGTTFSKLSDLGSGAKVDDAVVGGSLDAQQKAKLQSQSNVSLAGAMAGKTDVVSATITGSAVDARDVTVGAVNRLGTTNLAGGLGVGGLGVGGALAYTGLYGTTEAGIETSTVGASGAIAVSATNEDLAGKTAASVTAYAGGAGIVGVGAAFAVANLGQTVHATAGGTFTGDGGDAMSVKANDTGTVDVKAYGAAAGAAAAGIVVALGNRASTVTAELLANSNVSGFNGLTVDARSMGGISVYGLGASGGLLAAGTGVGVTASDTTDVIAQIGNSSVVNTGAGGTDVTASARPKVSAEGLGAAVSGGVAMGAVIVDANSGNHVTAQVGNDTRFTGAGGLDVRATLDHAAGVDSVTAKSTAGSGGLYLSAAASTATASNSSNVLAQTGDDVALPLGAINVIATNTTSQKASGTGVAVGGIAVGAVVVEATSNTVTDAHLGTNTHRNNALATPEAVVVQALGSDRNAASAQAGSGGLLAGNASVARTSATADVDAGIGGGSLLDVASLKVEAKHDTLYAATADSLNASLVGFSGANVENTATSNVKASIGDDATIASQTGVTLIARNNFSSDLGTNQISVEGAAGGVFSGSAAGVQTTLHGDTAVAIGDRANLFSGLDGDSTTADLSAVASTSVNTSDTASLSTGGAIAVAVVDASFDGTFNNRVDVGSGAELGSTGYLNLGTYTQATVASTALVNTWGLAAVGVSNSDIDIDTNDQVNVGGGALLTSLSNSYLTAGSDSTGLQDSRFTLSSTAEGYVRGLIAVPDSSASASVDGTASVGLAAGSNVLSASNVTVATNGATDTLNVSGVGHGYQLGFIPTTQRDSNSHAAHTGSLQLDGAILAGRYSVLDIVIDANGNLVQNSGLGVTATHIANFTPKAFLDSLCSPDPSAEGCLGLEALKGSVANGPVNAWQLGPMYASGGDVFLKSDRIAGSGNVTANGAPSISVVNNSNYYLLLDSIDLPDYQGGRVRFTGSASNAGSVAISEAASTALPTVFIHNAAQATDGPAIFAMEGIRNIGGLVHLRNDQGSLGQFGTVYAQQQVIEAPNGIVTFNNLGADFRTGTTPQADWRTYMLKPANANEAVAWIANIQYGSDNLTNKLLYRDPIFTGDAGNSIVLFGGCLPQNSGSCGENSQPFGTVGFHGSNMPIVPVRTVTKSISTFAENPTVATNAANNSFVGQQIYVRARAIDVNSTLDAGAGTNWSLKVMDEAGLDSWLAARDTTGGMFDIPSSFLGAIGGSRQITAKYDATNKRIIVDNVNASGGGYVFLDGQIVSSTPYGKIKVSSGFGQVHIDSTADRALQVQDVNVGSGAVGVVQLVDRLKQNLYGDALTTWYVSKQGQATVAYDNYYGATNYDAGNVRNLATPLSYAPKEGMRYEWTETAYVQRADKDGAWKFVNASGQILDPGQEWSTSGEGYVQRGAGGPAYSQTAAGSFNDAYTVYQGITYGCEGGGNSDCNYGFPNPPGGNNAEYNADGSFKRWATWWNYEFKTRGSVAVTGSVKADNAIAIDFSGATAGVIDIKADGDLLLTGKLSNQGGTTTLQADGTTAGGVGNIIKASDTASITAHDLVLNATGGVGVGTGSRGALDITTTGGGITASSGVAGIDLRVQSDAAVKLTAGNGTVGYGNVRLVANGNISGLAGQSTDISGADITLQSLFGGIGSLSDPLVLAAHETARANNNISGGIVNATAMNDIALTDTSGDFWVGSVLSQSGDVALRAPNGGLLDASLRTSADVLSDEQIARIRTQLKLDGSGVDDGIAAFEAQVVARYQEYWRLLGQGTMVNGVFVASANAVALFTPLAGAAKNLANPTEADVRGYIAERYDSLAAFFDTTFGTGWQQTAAFASENTAFAYAVNDAQRTDLSKNAAWTNEQLKYSINANALQPSAGGVGAADPTVSGRNVTVIARDGIGRLASDLNIDYVDLVAGNLTTEQALGLALANTPGDVEMLAADGHVLTRAELQLLADSGQSAGAIATLRIKRTSPLFVQVGGEFNGSAGGSAFVQATGDLKVGRFSTGGDARIAASGSLTDANSDGTAAIVTGGDLVVAAGSGSIGGTASDGSNQPLDIQVAGRLLSASSGQDARLRQTTGDLRVGSVFANGLVSLEAQNGSLVSYLDGVAIDGRDVTLVASGDIGHRDPAANAGVTGALQLKVAGSGLLNGSAGGQAWITSPDQALHVGTLTAMGNLNVTAGTGDLTAQQLTSSNGGITAGAERDVTVDAATAAGAIALTAVRDLRATQLDGQSATLRAGGAIAVGTATIDEGFDAQANGAFTVDAAGVVSARVASVQAASVAMGAGSAIRADDYLSLDTTGSMVLGELAVDASNNGIGEISLVAGGRIDGNGDGAVNLRGDAGAVATFTAGTGAGTAGTPLQVAIGTLAGGTSTTGDIFLSFPTGGTIGTVQAIAGSIDLASGGALVIDQALAQQSLHIDTQDMDATTLVATGGDLAVQAAGDATIGSASAGHDVSVSAGNSLAVRTVTSGGDMALDATDVRVQALVAGGNLAATAAGSMRLDDASVRGNATLVATDAAELGRLVVDHDLVASAGTDLLLDAGTVGGNATLDAAHIGIRGLDVGGTLRAVAVDAFDAQRLGVMGDTDLAATDLSVADANLAGDAHLRSSQATVLGTVVVGGDLNAAAGTTFDVAALSVAGNALLAAGTDLHAVALHVEGGLDASALNDLVIDTGSVGGAALLASGNDTRVGTLAVTGDLVASAAANLVGGTVTAGGNATLDSGADTTLQALTVGGDLDAHAARTLAIVDGAVGGNATLDAGIDATLGTLDVRGELAATAARTLALGRGTVGGNAALASGADTAVGTLDVTGALLVDAGTDLSITDGTVGGNAMLQSGDATDLGRLDVEGNLDALAGTTLRAGMLGVRGDADLRATDLDVTRMVVDGDVDLASSATMHVGDAAIGGVLRANAGGDLALDSATIDGTATLRSGAATMLGAITTGGTLDMVSQGDIRYADLDSGADIVGTSIDGSILGGNARAKGRINFLAAKDIAFDTVVAGDRIDLTAGQDIVGGSAHAITGDLVATAGRDLDIGHAEAGRDVLLDAQRTMTLGTVKAGRDIGLAAGNSVLFGTLDAGHDVRAQSRAGDVIGDTVIAGHDAILGAAGRVQVGQATVGHDLDADAGTSVGLGRYTAGHDVRLDAGTDIAVGTGQAAGSTQYTAGGSIAFDSVASRSRVDMLAAGGDLIGGSLTAPVAQLAARDHLQLDLARIDNRLNLAATDIDANVVQGGTGNDPLSMVLTGYRNGVARRITMSVDARDAWIMDRLSALEAKFTTTAPNVKITAGHIEKSMDLVTPSGRTWMNNLGTTLELAQVQLTQPTFDFEMEQRRNFTFTDAFVVRYGEGFWVEAPNHVGDRDWVDTDYFAESALRYTFRTLDNEPREDSDDEAQVRALAAEKARARRDLIESPLQGAVNTGISQ